MCAARSATDSRTRRTVLREFEIKRRMSLTPVCCSSASERCPRASASSRVRASSCLFNSISELGPLLTCALAFVPVERSLRPRVGLFAPLRDKVTSSAQPLVPSGQPSLSILTEPRDELAPSYSITSSASASILSGSWRPSVLAVLALITRSNLDRQVSRLLTLENPSDINAGPAIRVWQAWSLAHQSTPPDIFTQVGDHGHRVFCGTWHDSLTLAVEEWFGRHDEAAGVQLSQ